jgi:hypothetical protein
MPVLINNLKTKGYFKVRINLDEAFDAEDETQAEYAEEWAGAYIDLRELNANESALLQEKHDVETFSGILRNVIVGHNIYREENKMASSDEVIDLIHSSSTIYSHVMASWMASLPLAKRSGKRSASLPKTLLEAAASQDSIPTTQGDTSR